MSESSITTAAGIARALGISERSLFRYFGAGCPRANGNGVYDLAAIRQWRDANIGRPDAADDGLGLPCLFSGCCQRTGEAITRETGYAEGARESKEIKALARLVIRQLADRVLAKVPKKTWRNPPRRLRGILLKESSVAVEQFHQALVHLQSGDWGIVTEILAGQQWPVDEDVLEPDLPALLVERGAADEEMDRNNAANRAAND